MHPLWKKAAGGRLRLRLRQFAAGAECAGRTAGRRAGGSARAGHFGRTACAVWAAVYGYISAAEPVRTAVRAEPICAACGVPVSARAAGAPVRGGVCGGQIAGRVASVPDRHDLCVAGLPAQPDFRVHPGQLRPAVQHAAAGGLLRARFFRPAIPALHASGRLRAHGLPVPASRPDPLGTGRGRALDDLCVRQKREQPDAQDLRPHNFEGSSGVLGRRLCGAGAAARHPVGDRAGHRCFSQWSL